MFDREAFISYVVCMKANQIHTRRFEEQDWLQVWSVMEPVFRLGQMYAFPVDISEAEAHKAWVETPQQTYVVEMDGYVVGTYYIKPYHPGRERMSATAATW